MATNKKLTPLQILYKEFKNAKTDDARNEAWRNFEIKRGEMYPPRSDRKSAMLRDSAAVAAKYPTKVLGGENHRYYEPGRRIRMDVDETARRSPDVWIDPESGERYVSAFHYTQPENIDNILKTGLVSRLGPDAVNYQNRPGVWTSMSDANPMGYDFVNKAYLGDENFSMEPLEIRIPEEEWKAMPVDHTGKTGDDQVMVFRDSPSNPYGNAKVNGIEYPVAIPAEYIRRYNFPENWTTDHPLGGKTLYGYTPLKSDATPVNDRGFVESLPDELSSKAKEAVGENATYNDLAQWLTKNDQRSVKNAIVEQDLYPMRDNEFVRGFRGNSFSNPFNRLTMGLQKNRNNEENVRVLNLPYEAKRDWFLGTEFETPFDLAKATEATPRQGTGSVIKGYRGDVFPLGTETPRTKKFLTDAIGDKVPISTFVEGSPKDFNADQYIKNAEMMGVKIPTSARDFSSTGYEKNAGVRFELGQSYNRNDVRDQYNRNDPLVAYNNNETLKQSARHKLGFIDNQLYKDKFKAKFDEFHKAGDVDGMLSVLDEYKKEKKTPEHTRRRIDYVLGDWKPKRERFEEGARNLARREANLSDEFSKKIRSDALKMQEEHPSRSIIDLERIAYQEPENQNLLDKLANEKYEESLQRVMNNKRNDWRKQFTQDSLNRVFGHELGRKIGKYRASRGKPVNPKQL